MSDKVAGKTEQELVQERRRQYYDSNIDYNALAYEASRLAVQLTDTTKQLAALTATAKQLRAIVEVVAFMEPYRKRVEPPEFSIGIDGELGRPLGKVVYRCTFCGADTTIPHHKDCERLLARELLDNTKELA